MALPIDVSALFTFNALNIAFAPLSYISLLQISNYILPISVREVFVLNATDNATAPFEPIRFPFKPY